jgi:hypothetical protein
MTQQITEDFEKENPYFRDNKEEPFGPHRMTNAIRDIMQDFFQEYDELFNLDKKRIQQQQEYVEGNPEEKVLDNENPTKVQLANLHPELNGAVEQSLQQ